MGAWLLAHYTETCEWLLAHIPRHVLAHKSIWKKALWAKKALSFGVRSGRAPTGSDQWNEVTQRARGGGGALAPEQPRASRVTIVFLRSEECADLCFFDADKESAHFKKELVGTMFSLCLLFLFPFKKSRLVGSQFQETKTWWRIFRQKQLVRWQVCG